MKVTLNILLALGLVFGVAACSGNGDDTTKPEAPAEETAMMETVSLSIAGMT